MTNLGAKIKRKISWNSGKKSTIFGAKIQIIIPIVPAADQFLLCLIISISIPVCVNGRFKGGLWECTGDASRIEEGKGNCSTGEAGALGI